MVNSEVRPPCAMHLPARMRRILSTLLRQQKSLPTGLMMMRTLLMFVLWSRWTSCLTSILLCMWNSVPGCLNDRGMNSSFTLVVRTTVLCMWRGVSVV